jgi:membrane protein DedA with SNARE-associated domain
MAGSVRSPPVTEQAEQERRRIPLPWLITPIVVLSVAGTVGDIMGPRLIDDHPLWMMFLNPRTRWLLLASPQVAAVPFFVVGFLRLVLTDPIFYILGIQYGDGALRWMEEKMGDGGRFIRAVKRWFAKAGPLIILIAPSGYLCLFAGFSRMSLRVFVTMNVVGTIGRLILFRIAGEAFRDELLDVVGWISRNQKWLIALSLGVVVLQSVRARNRPTGAFETPAEIEAEIEAYEQSSGTDDHPPKGRPPAQER